MPAFDITVEDVERLFKQTPVCPILGINIAVGEGSIKDHSPTIDRKDNALGYTHDNIQLLSYQANRMKSNASPEQLVLFAQWVQKTIPC